ncbi:ATP-binding cassette domain-containing protein [Ruminococcus flavefaciens]|uniref:ATP-binding cassette domain-containing protein n=1 Tax=Ruminococcus flavefaciens TaxID=1265 RepID=UPI0026ECB3CF|nr:ABC transporter ATP-binding protein [Ruminococcus flavefaciens]
MEYVLKTKNICKQYKRSKALDGLTMNVPKGSIYGFVGRNGAGKTTLIRIVCGMQLPTSGEFELYGVKDSDGGICNSRRRIGSVIETPSIYTDMTAEDNLRQQYQVLGLPDFSGIPELLKLVGLGDTGRKKVRNFSLGMRQRLGIAVALCGSPDFLVLDEPVNGLDPEGIVEVRELILKLNRERKITVLISSHILDELSKLATHYGFINNGRIIREMSAEELEASCRKCMRLTVTDTAVLSTVLDRMGIDFKINDESSADIYAKPNITQLSLALANEGCEVLSLEEHDESLESFYISLIGGADHA